MVEELEHANNREAVIRGVIRNYSDDSSDDYSSDDDGIDDDSGDDDSGDDQGTLQTIGKGSRCTGYRSVRRTENRVCDVTARSGSRSTVTHSTHRSENMGYESDDGE